MTLYFDNQAPSMTKCIWFVGATGDKSGHVDNGGGATKAWWDAECPNHTEAEHYAAMNKLIGSNGAPIQNRTASWINSTTRIEGSGIETGVEIGMIVFAEETPTPNTDFPTGRYRITDVGTNYVEIDDNYDGGSGDCSINIRIGGALDKLETAHDAAVNTSTTGVAGDLNHTQQIYTNKDETLTSTLTMDVGGTRSENAWKIFTGFHIAPGDMNPGGSYYESCQDILRNSKTIDATKCVTYDANNGSYDIFTFSSINAIILENFHLTNTNTGAYNGTDYTGSCNYHHYRNCRFTDVDNGANYYCNDIVLDHCWFETRTHSVHVWGGAGLIINCCASILGTIGTFVAAVSTTALLISTATVIGCTVDGNGLGEQPFRIVETESGDCTIYAFGNSFYDFEYAVQLQDGSITIRNNIFLLTAVASSFAYKQISGYAGVVDEDWNCFYCKDGAVADWVDGSQMASEPVPGPNTLQVDPMFVDAENGDFRLKENSPCLVGMEIPIGAVTPMGAWHRKGVIRS